MLRMPRKHPARCVCGTCRVCTDPIAAGVAALAAAMEEPDTPQLGGKTVAVPARVAAPLLPALPKLPARPAPDFNEFDKTMAALTNRARTGRADDVKGDR